MPLVVFIKSHENILRWKILIDQMFFRADSNVNTNL